MKATPFVLAYNGFVLVAFTAINASPLSSFFADSIKSMKHTIEARQAGTYNGYDDSRPVLAGTYHCFKGGTWMLNSQINGTLDQACGTSIFDHDASHFNFTLDPNGKNAQQLVQHKFRHCGAPHPFGEDSSACQPPDKQYVSFEANFKSEMFADTDYCRYGMRKILEYCYGKKNYTRGGWWQFSGDNSTYGIDPTTAGSNE